MPSNGCHRDNGLDKREAKHPKSETLLLWTAPRGNGETPPAEWTAQNHKKARHQSTSAFRMPSNGCHRDNGLDKREAKHPKSVTSLLWTAPRGKGKHHQQNGQPKTTKKRDTNQPLPSGCLPMDATEIMDLIKEKQNTQKARLSSFGLLQGGMGKHHQQNGQPKTTKKPDTNQPLPSGCLSMDSNHQKSNTKKDFSTFGLLQG